MTGDPYTDDELRELLTGVLTQIHGRELTDPDRAKIEKSIDTLRGRDT